MADPKPITIVGGGLAGLTLGVALRRRGLAVTVWEAGRYPRHRVCGEFISGRGQDSLRRLGLLEKFLDAGARAAGTAAFFSSRAASPPKMLPHPALCLSRHVMDELLAQEFGRLGGELRINERWRGKNWEAGVVRATGRRIQHVVAGWRWFGLKVHARKVELTADLEMHLAADGYVGLCRLPGGEVNICGLFRRRDALPEAPHLQPGFLRGRAGTHLHERLANAVFDPDSFCSVAGLSLEPPPAAGRPEFCVGDSLAMIPPVTGNGMSMAFESAELAVGPLEEFSRGKISWAETQAVVARCCDERFGRRLAWARVLQRGLFMRGTRAVWVGLVPRTEWLWRLWFERTR